MSIWALDILKAATKAGYGVIVDFDGEYVRTKSAVKAWNMVKEVEEANVWIVKRGAPREWMFLMAPGPMSCSDDETVVDYSIPEVGGFVEKTWRKMFDEEMERA